MELTTDAQNEPTQLLCVDDDEFILRMFERTLADEAGLTIQTATSGAEGLAILEQQAIDIVVSDLQMPEMNGSEFLARVAERWPSSLRILLTGEADLEQTVAAINAGQIFQYLQKPWAPDELRGRIRDAISRVALQRERDALQAITQQQNAELQELNKSLEQKVAERTRHLDDALQELAAANEHLKQGMVNIIRIGTNLLESRNSALAGHARETATTCAALASHFNLDSDAAQALEFAALLHQLGKIGMSDQLVSKAREELNYKERRTLDQYPTIGAGMLMALDEFEATTTIIRSHREHFDGSGLPESLVGDDIPLGARILLVATDYIGLQTGLLLKRNLKSAEALAHLRLHAGQWYDPQVLDALEALGDVQPSERQVRVMLPKMLKPGYVMASDLRPDDSDVVLLTQGFVLKQNIIDRLIHFEHTYGRKLEVAVYVEPDGVEPV